jgi:hypothetical protein
MINGNNFAMRGAFLKNTNWVIGKLMIINKNIFLLLLRHFK